jgi:hypothetical protein
MELLSSQPFFFFVTFLFCMFLRYILSIIHHTYIAIPFSHVLYYNLLLRISQERGMDSAQSPNY